MKSLTSHTWRVLGMRSFNAHARPWARSPALADTRSSTTTATTSNAPVDVTSATPDARQLRQLRRQPIARTIVGLLIVIAVIYGLSWILKPVAKAATQPRDRVTASSRSPRCRSAPNRSVALVRVGAELHLLGSRRARRHRHPHVHARRRPTNSASPSTPRTSDVRRRWRLRRYNAWSRRCGGSRSGRAA